MNVDDIVPVMFDIYKRYNIHSFPINVFELLWKIGYDTRRYSNLNEKQRKSCNEISHDACMINRTIFYNDIGRSDERIRFSLMHELGHVVLNSKSEDDADLFAATFLAPPHIIISGGIKTSTDVATTFGISITAADRALYASKNWLSMYKKHPIDFELRDWFKEAV